MATETLTIELDANGWNAKAMLTNALQIAAGQYRDYRYKALGESAATGEPVSYTAEMYDNYEKLIRSIIDQIQE